MGEGNGDGDSQPGDTMVERADASTVKLWLLLNANRWTIAAGLMLVVFLGLVGASLLSPMTLRETMATEAPENYLFQALTTALITGVTLVVTINQLVLSQELGAAEDQRDRLEGSMKFRRDVEDAVGLEVSPPEPASYLQAIVSGTEDRAETFRESVSGIGDEELEADVDDFVDNLTEHAEQIDEELEGAQFGTYAVLRRAMDYNYSWKIFRARRIRNNHSESLDDEAEEALDDLLEILKLFGLAREHFKTLYFQWDLINLSRAMMYISVPALVVTASMILFFEAEAVVGSTLGVDNLTWIAAAAVTIGVTPFLVLVSFVLRIATMAKRTLAIGPFILRESMREEEIEQG